eukprot:6019702-Prymnesium_polylepis.1
MQSSMDYARRVCRHKLTRRQAEQEIGEASRRTHADTKDTTHAGRNRFVTSDLPISIPTVSLRCAHTLNCARGSLGDRMEAKSIGSIPITQEAVSPFRSTVMVCNLAVGFVAGWLTFAPNDCDAVKVGFETDTGSTSALKPDAADSGASPDASSGCSCCRRRCSHA